MGLFAKSVDSNQNKFSPNAPKSTQIQKIKPVGVRAVKTAGTAVKSTASAPNLQGATASNAGNSKTAKAEAGKAMSAAEENQKTARGAIQDAAQDNGNTGHAFQPASSGFSSTAGLFAGGFSGFTPIGIAVVSALSVVPSKVISGGAFDSAVSKASDNLGVATDELLNAAKPSKNNKKVKKAIATQAAADESLTSAKVADEEMHGGRTELANAMDGNEQVITSLMEDGLDREAAEAIFGMYYDPEALGLKPDNKSIPDNASSLEQLAENNVAFNVPQMRM